MFAPSPPKLPEPLTWREIYAGRAFAGRGTLWDSQFISAAEKRGHRLGIGSKQLEALDLAGALRPVAFRKTASIGDFPDPTRDLRYLTFRDETETADWSTHAWMPHDHPHVSADYSPWQLLYVDRAIGMRSMSFGLDVFESGPDELMEMFERWRPWRDEQAKAWSTLDDEWRPLIKLLVILQSRFYPEVTGSTPVQADIVDGEPQYIDVYRAERHRWNSAATAERLGLSAEHLHEAFWFLVERGIDHEPQDGLTRQRRVAFRHDVDRWRGEARVAQDHFDAAEVIRQFIIGLTGEAPRRIPRWPLDGRQSERELLYDEGPATRADHTRRLEVAKTGATYPHQVHAVVEGESEVEFLRRLAERFVGVGADEGFTFTNLHGTGRAKQLIRERMLTVAPMVKRAVVIVDDEGDVRRIVEKLKSDEILTDDDLHLASGSLEEENATPDELVAIARSFADDERLSLKLTGDELAARFDDQRGRAGKDAKGLAEVLIDMARHPERGAVTLSKPQMAVRLADLATDDFLDAGPDQRDAVLARRPLLAFFLKRVASELRP